MASTVLRGNTPALWILLISAILVRGNDPPRWISDHKTVILKENSLNGTLVKIIKATDKDGDPITFKIDPNSPETKRLVRLDNATGDSKTGRSVDVILNVGDLDRDLKSNSDMRTLRFQVCDGTQCIKGTIVLAIEDVNEPPTFEKLPYRASIKEDAPNGTLVFNGTQTRDLDTGYGGIVTYRFENTDAAHERLFLVTPHDGFLYLNGLLDYEEAIYYRLILIAVDGGNLSATAEVIITVKDVEDSPPFFVNSPYIKRLLENVTVNSSVLSVMAMDGDQGRPNPITYAFICDTHNDSFKIDNTTGIITVNKDLDSDDPDLRAQRGVFDLTVMATETNKTLPQKGVTTSTIIVTIYIDDINDNAPTFSKTNYNATVLENTPNDIHIALNESITVEDIDQGKNSKFRMWLQNLDGTNHSVFYLAPKTVFGKASVIIYVKNSSILDYEALKENGREPTLTFIIVAEETDTPDRHTGSATVTVYVEDQNDHSPEFGNSSHEVLIPENAVIGDVVTQITAIDKDSGKYGKITYQLRGGGGMFSVSKDNGTILVAKIPLDRETMSKYYLNLEAIDGGGLHSKVQMSVTVILTDINDNTPVFQWATYSGYLRESQTTFQGRVVLKATDLDEETTNNSEVRYRISGTPHNMGNNFTINDTTGELGVVTPLDFEELAEDQTDSLTIQVMAYDLGNPPLNSTVNVVITVEDINDNEPVFSSEIYEASVMETASQDQLVTIVNATDADGKGPNSVIYYGISSGGLDKFLMDSVFGNLTVGGTLDRDVNTVGGTLVRDAFTLTVLAIDRGSPPKTGTATVRINVTDVNNKPPVFRPANVTASVPENKPVNSTVITWNATDADEDHRLEYVILKNSTKGRDERGRDVDQNLINHYFDVHIDSGDIYVSSELDRETVETVIIEVLVTDTNAAVNPESQTATGTLTITLLDYNDNPPEFDQLNGYNLNISEGAGLGTEVLSFVQQRTFGKGHSVKDKDKDQTITFRIHDPADQFKIDEGIVILNKPLDREREEHHEFTLTAYDNGVPPLSTNVTVRVEVIDENDNTPQFQTFDVGVNIGENCSVGSNVATISATDADSGDFGRVQYYINTGDDGKFEINSTTGLLTVREKLDRENVAAYTISIEARDNAGDHDPRNRNSNYTTIIITLEDVNDNVPSFNGTAFHVNGSVDERREVGVRVYQLQATDPDKDLNGEIFYSLNNTGAATNATNENEEALFRIDQSGVIFVNRSLVNNVDWRYMTVVATDKGTPPRSASATVFVFIQDENINAPIFVTPARSPMTINLMEEEAPNQILYKVSASDKDQGQNGQVVFELIEEFGIRDLENFTLDADSGELRSKYKLDYETKTSYSLFIKASDHGQPVLSSVVRLDVEVTDINDHSPQFDPTKYPRDSAYNMYAVEEKTQLLESVDFAEDKDGANNSVVCYCLLGDRKDFEIDNTTGEIDLVTKIDREENPGPIQLVVQALEICDRCDSTRKTRAAVETPPDGYNQSDHSMLWVQVNIVDINDNPPVFTRKVISVGITRDTQNNSIVIRLPDFVTDADLPGNNTVHSYFIVGKMHGVGENLDSPTSESATPAPHPFLLSKRGILMTNVFFRSDMSGHFTMRVQAEDSAGNDTADLKVFLINNDEQVKIILRGNPEEVSAISNELVSKLENVTGGIYDIIVDKIQTHEDQFGKPHIDKTDLFIHGVEKNVGGIPGTELLRAIDGKINLLIDAYKKYHVIEILPAVSMEQEDTQVVNMEMSLVLVSILLGTIAVVLGSTLYICRRTYERKLRAATAVSFGEEAEKSKTDMPGTNLHTTEGSNPVWLGDYEHLDTPDNPDCKDHDSLNSLDVNEIEPTPENDYDEQEVSMDLYNDDEKIPTSKLSRPTDDIYRSAVFKENESWKNDLVNDNSEIFAANGAMKHNGAITAYINNLQTTEI